jgi:Diiron non-heme beta-hydroxylase N-terminal domain/Beta-lactamase superfamily domain
MSVHRMQGEEFLMVDTQHTMAPDAGDDRPVYLKPTVKIEPLICGWLAWGHLLSPVQAAMNFAFRYLPLLQSFITNPQVHVSATKDPRLFGGPFVNLSADHVSVAEELMAMTRSRLARLLKLAADTKAFDTLLQGEAKGFSLNDLYARLPDSLSGLVELMYDINNHPRIAFLEQLLYAEYGADLRRGVQQILLTDVSDSERDFFMSTPRVPRAESLTLDIGYADRAVEKLVSMQLKPMPLRALTDTLGLREIGEQHRRFFTPSPPQRNAPDYSGDRVRIRYFGHASVLIQTARASILIDPTFASEPSAADSGCVRFTIHDLPDRIDYLVVSHCHQDHFSPEVLLQLRGRVGTIVVPLNHRGSITDPSMKLILAELGFSNVISLGDFDTVQFEGGGLTSIPFPGEHSDLDIYSKQSLCVDVLGRKVLFLVDSDGRDPVLYRRISRMLLSGPDERIDAIFLGMECYGAPLNWLYGPLLTKPISRRDDESRRLSGSNCARALQIIQQFKCSRVYVYAMGQEPWLRYAMGMEYAPDSIQLKESNKLVEHCRAAGMISERLYGSQDIFL